MSTHTIRIVIVVFGLALISAINPSPSFAEFRSAKDMQKECRVALDVLLQRADRSFENTLFTGECIGYIQGAVDASQPFSKDVDWYKVCVPDTVPSSVLIEKFIAFVDKFPELTLASTTLLLMLVDEYPCKK
jgi:Rap1a immunity proteins